MLPRKIIDRATTLVYGAALQWQMFLLYEAPVYLSGKPELDTLGVVALLHDRQTAVKPGRGRDRDMPSPWNSLSSISSFRFCS